MGQPDKGISQQWDNPTMGQPDNSENPTMGQLDNGTTQQMDNPTNGQPDNGTN